MARKSTGTGRTAREGAKLAERRAAIFKRWLGGESIRDIARTVELSSASVGIDIQLAGREWRDGHRGSIQQEAERTVDRLVAVEIEAQRSFELSRGPKGDKPGDDAFLKVILECIKQRRGLLGLDRPTKIEQTTTAEVKVSSNFKTIDELRAEIARHQHLWELRKGAHQEALKKERNQHAIRSRSKPARAVI